jgi:YidC/Oxa1 family membrane protein insertase
MEKNKTLIAVVLSIFVIMTYQLWMAKRYPRQEQPAPAQSSTPIQQEIDRPIDLSEKPIPIEEEEQIVETDKFILTFSNVGGAIKRVALKEFADSETGRAYELIDIKDPRAYVGTLSLADGELSDGATYQMTKTGSKISFVHRTPNLEIEKVYNVYNSSDYIELYVTLRNNSEAEFKAASRIVAGSGINASSMMSQRYHYVSSKIDGNISWFKKDSSKPGDVSWITLNNEYFFILLRPYQLARKAFIFTLQKGDVKKRDLACGIENPILVVPKGAENTQQYLLYIGPFDAGRLKALDMGLEDAVNYGKLNGIVKALLSTLKFFQKIVRNWGLAIIFMTVLVNAILFPLTRNSYKSLKVSQEIQPQIEKLRAAHKDNPNKAQKEIMELYRKYKVNPLGGCLPMFLQFPIFFALYHVLIRSVELKGSNFLWIKDLSRPDSLGLPFSLPFLGESINILPIAAAAVMVVQQKVMSARKTDNVSEQMKQQQAMMMIMIPAMMLIFFYKMPSGFVLYFLINSALMAYVQHKIKTSLA